MSATINTALNVLLVLLGLLIIAFLYGAYFAPEDLRSVACFIRTDSTVEYQMCRIF